MMFCRFIRYATPLLLGVLLLPTAAHGQATQPFTSYMFPAGAKRGSTTRATVIGANLLGASGVRVSGAGVSAKVAKVTNVTTAVLSITVDASAEVGEHEIRLVTPGGITNRSRFVVGQIPEIIEKEPNSEKSQAQRIESLPVLINGQIMEGDRDYFRFTAKAGQTLVFEAQARALLPFIADAVPGWLDACLTLYDASGKELKSVDDFRFRPDPLMVYKVPKDGEYLIEIRDILFRGRGDFVYRLSIGALPSITHIYPLGGQRGTTVRVQLYGANLPTQAMDVAIPADSAAVRNISVTRDGLRSNEVSLAAGEMKEIFETEPNDTIATANKAQMPVTINGRIDKRGDADYFAFSAEAGQKLVMEVRARRLDSPLDSILTLYNAKGAKVAENDDAVDPSESLLTHHADSRLIYTISAKGEYVLRIRDVQGNGGEEYAYRLHIAPARPDFALRVTPDNPRVGKGDSTMLSITAIRKDGFDGAISLAAQGLPAGFMVSDAVILGNQDQTALTITAPADAPTSILSPTVVGTAKAGAETLVRKAVLAEVAMQAFSFSHIIPTKESVLAVVEAGHFSLSADKSPRTVLEVRQGAEFEIRIKVARGAGIKGGVSFKMASTTPGVQVKLPLLAADKDEMVATATVSKQAVVGQRHNIVITGTMKVGKDNILRVLPAIPVVILAAPAEAKP